MEVIATFGKYKVVKSIGRYFNTRYELLSRYSYWENGYEKTGWEIKIFSPKLEFVMAAFERRKEGIVR